jgi:hypothetical protein
VFRFCIGGVEVTEEVRRSVFIDPVADEDAVGKPSACGDDRLSGAVVESRAAGIGLWVTDPADQAAAAGLWQRLCEEVFLVDTASPGTVTHVHCSNGVKPPGGIVGAAVMDGVPDRLSPVLEGLVGGSLERVTAGLGGEHKCSVLSRQAQPPCRDEQVRAFVRAVARAHQPQPQREVLVHRCWELVSQLCQRCRDEVVQFGEPGRDWRRTRRGLINGVGDSRLV